MTDFEEYKYTGEQIANIGSSAKKNCYYFAFQPARQDGIYEGTQVNGNYHAQAAPRELKFNEETGVISGQRIDIGNLEIVLSKFGLLSDENNFTSTLKYTASKNNNVENTYLSNKFLLQRKNNFRVCKFVLESLHDLFWQRFSQLDANGNAGRLIPIKTGMDIRDAFKLIEEPADGLFKIFNAESEMKAPSNLAAWTLKHEIEVDKLETEHNLKPTKKTKQKTKKQN